LDIQVRAPAGRVPALNSGREGIYQGKPPLHSS